VELELLNHLQLKGGGEDGDPLAKCHDGEIVCHIAGARFNTRRWNKRSAGAGPPKTDPGSNGPHIQKSSPGKEIHFYNEKSDLLGGIGPINFNQLI
jgi:hypothetical protein